ncbi:MAG: hypothetical protein KF850_20330 [Labilithrix sp.]|nr:hypothetical protein [Labilithrix sp.]
MSGRLRGALAIVALACLAGACGGADAGRAEAQTPAGGIRDVIVVLKGSSEPLPFDPRGGRLTIVTQEITRLLGHPLVLELDAALSPELVASLEETVLASFETVARELVLLQKEDPEMFAKARAIERVACVYDAVAKESDGKLDASGKLLVVRAPPDRFPLLERWVVTQAVYDAHIGDLEARWGEAEPSRLAPREQAPYFAYMTATRPGAGYLWIAARAKNGGRWDQLRVEHVGRILALADVVDAREPLARKVRRFLLGVMPFVGGLGGARGAREVDPAVIRRVVGAYEAWLARSVPSLDDEERLMIARAVLDRHSGSEVVLPGFDRFAFGMSVWDAWVQDGARTELPEGPRGKLHESVVCPVKRRGEAETEIRYGCSDFFRLALGDDALRARLAGAIAQRRDTKLLETALLNLGYGQGSQALALVESMKDEALFRHGVSVLFHDLARRDDVKNALEKAAPRWWRDAPGRRGLTLLVMARQWERLGVHYGDNQWTRFVAEFGGRVPSDVFAAYLAEGARAVEMAPTLWPALTKDKERDELLAKSLPVLLGRDRDARSSRARPMLVLLRGRLCEEKNAAGLETFRATLERWRSAHPDDAAAVSNAVADFTLARCAKPAGADGG